MPRGIKFECNPYSQPSHLDYQLAGLLKSFLSWNARTDLMPLGNKVTGQLEVAGTTGTAPWWFEF